MKKKETLEDRDRIKKQTMVIKSGFLLLLLLLWLLFFRKRKERFFSCLFLLCVCGKRVFTKQLNLPYNPGIDLRPLFQVD